MTTCNHDNVGENMPRKFLNYFNADENLINIIFSVIRWHI